MENEQDYEAGDPADFEVMEGDVSPPEERRVLAQRERQAQSERLSNLESRQGNVEDAMQAHRQSIAAIRQMVEKFTDVVQALERRIIDSDETTRRLAQNFEKTTREISQANIEALQDVVKKFVGNWVLEGVKYIIGSAAIGLFGLLWYNGVLTWLRK